MEDLINDFQYICSINNTVEQSLKSAQEDLDPMKALTLLNRIRDEDIPLFDMDSSTCKPTDLIITHIPVPPSCIRPSVAVSHTTTNEDDLTIKLAEILQLNSNIKISI